MNSYSAKGLQILELLGAGNKPTDVAKAIPCAKSNVTYWIKRWIAKKAIKLQCKDVYKTYSLTPYGSTVLTRSEKLASAAVAVIEDYAVKCGIIEHEKTSINWRKLGDPRNWVKLGVKFDGVTVEKTTQNVIIHSGRLKGFDVDELMMRVGSIVQRVQDILENKFGMVLGHAVPVHDKVVRFYSKEADELLRLYGTTTVEGVGSLDDSPPHGQPHEEHPENVAKERLLMPLRVARLDSETQGLRTEIQGLRSELHTEIEGLRGDVVELVKTLREVMVTRSNEVQGANPFAV